MNTAVVDLLSVSFDSLKVQSTNKTNTKQGARDLERILLVLVAINMKKFAAKK
jgi:hypothetical protein